MDNTTSQSVMEWHIIQSVLHVDYAQTQQNNVSYNTIIVY